MKKQTFRPNAIVSMLAIAFYPLSALAQEPQGDSTSSAAELGAVEVKAQRLHADEKGQDDVFTKPVSNAYVGREYLERFRVNAAGDVLKGLNGVYNMNTRTAGGAITPNIRGITGKGRIPVTLDGTEQTVDVWMNNYGVGDRNYLDPALFRSIMVEKSPALTRGVKSGVGGAVAIRTIEPTDIIPEGKNWGVQIKGELANNARKPANNFNQYLGWPDYRTLPIGATADGAGGGADPITGQVSPWGLVMDDAQPPRHKQRGDNYRFGADQSYTLAAAFKTDMTDGLAAYSYRNKGNFFAGTGGAGGYRNNPVYNHDSCWNAKNGSGNAAKCLSSASFIPNMANIYHPGVETFNSNTETTTRLLKNNWYLPNQHKLGWQYMRTDVGFGEINPFHTTYILNMEDHNATNRPRELSPQVQSLNSKIRTDTYKLGWSWKPDNSRLIDLDANLWHIRTRSTRHQSGGMDLSVAAPDPFYDAWHWCNKRGKVPPYLASDYKTCDDYLSAFGIKGKTKQEAMQWMQPLADQGKFAVISGAEQKTQVRRTGFDISNRFTLSDRLKLTLSADYQEEKLREEVQIVNSQDLFNLVGMTTGLSKLAGPRGGQRREWGGNVVLDWQATDRLKLSAGVRYHHFRGEDTALAEGRARRDPRYAAGGGGHEYYQDGVILPYWEVAGDQEAKDTKAVFQQQTDAYASGNAAAIHAADSAWQAHGAKYGLSKWSTSGVHGIHGGKYTDRGRNYAYFRDDGTIYSINHAGPINTNLSGPLYRLRPVYIPFVNGRIDAAVLDRHYRKGMFEEKVNNPQGLQGTYNRYYASQLESYNVECKTPGCTNRSYIDRISEMTRGYAHSSADTKTQSGVILRKYTDDQIWAKPQPIRAHAWSPTIAATYDLTDNTRLFARYAQMTRFPSVYEVGSLYNDVAYVSQPKAPRNSFKPERSRSWEIGYSWNFAPYWKALHAGDVRLTYYRNRIHNLIETTDYFRTIQYDRKDTTGLELQSRIDTGRFFATLGATYRLKQQVCDRASTADFDPYGDRGLPTCIEGGYGSTRGYQALQPKYSINLDMGTRLLGEKLELGLRGIYHSSVNRKQYDRLLEKGFGPIFNSTGKPYHWRPSLVWDVYGRYQANKNLSFNFSVANLTNRYYLDPMSNVPAPGPGRTFNLGITARF